MSMLARFLGEGAGVPRDLRGSMRWRRAAAAHGTYDDWTNLGVGLHEGKGVRRNDREAVR